MENTKEKSSEQLNSLDEFNFAETAILAGNVRTVEMVALKPVCENLGISWSWQFEQLKNDTTLSQLFGKEKVLARDNKQYDMICLPMATFQEWLWALNPTENMNIQLWEHYKKGLVYYLTEMLRVSMAEVQRLRNIERLYFEVNEKVEAYFYNDSTGKEHYAHGKEFFKINKNLKEEILQMFKRDPSQLALDF